MEYPKYKKLIFCTDFSENADYAFDFAYGIAKRDGGLLYILHVIPGNPQEVFVERFISRDIVEQIHKVIENDVSNKYTEHYVKKMGNSVPFKIVTKCGREDEEILKFAKEEKADLIVMGTHGRTGVEKAFFGSVAEKVLRRSPVPVFVVPCKKRLEGF